MSLILTFFLVMEAVVLSDLPGAPKGKVAIVGQEITSIPTQLASSYGATAIELSISYCQIKYLLLMH